MKKVRASALLLLFALASLPVKSEVKSAPAEDLHLLVAAAVTNNPEVKSSEARWKMFTSKAKQATALDDPMLMLKLQSVSPTEPWVLNRDPQSAKVIGLSQQLPFWGKRALRQEVANHEAESWRWAVEERKLELTRMVTESYYQIWGIDKELAVLDKNLKLLADFVAITELKYSLGQGVQQDIFKAGLEKSRMLEMQISLQQQRKSVEANLNYLLHRSGNTSVGTVADFALPQVTLSPEQLYTTATERRPQVKSLTSLVLKSEASQRLAEREKYPDFNLSLEYMFREPVSTTMAPDPGDDMVTLGVTFNLPYQQEKRREMRSESGYERIMANEELNALKSSISLTINETLVQMERRRKLVELYKGGIIPQAEQSLESALISYQVGKVDFLTLLDSRMNLFNAERALYDSQVEYMMKLAQLEAATGTELATPSKPPHP
ncbi:MAG: TolC family protein [Chlorobium sp.]